jgi:hypothetical protein
MAFGRISESRFSTAPPLLFRTDWIREAALRAGGKVISATG